MIPVLLLAAALTTPAAVDELVVRLRPSTRLSAEREFTLGDVATLEGPGAERAAAVPLGTAPAAGRNRGLSRRTVLAALERAGFPATRVAVEGASLTRLSGIGQPLDAERVRVAVKRELPRLVPGARVRVGRVRVPAGLLVPTGAYEVALLDPHRPLSSGTVRLPVEIRPEVGRPRRTGVLVELTVEAPQLVAAREVPRGAVLSAEDVAVETRPVRPGGPWLSSPRAAVGRMARATLRAGEPIPAGLVGAARDVETGQPVVALLRRGGIELALDTVARGSGSKGAIVPVVGPDGRRVVRARVTGPGRVSILGSDEAGPDGAREERDR